MTSIEGGATRSAIIAPALFVESVVGRHRAELDSAASWGVPAHVTILFPFVPPHAIDQSTIDRVACVASRLEPVDVVLREVQWFGEDVVYLAPEPAGWFRSATERMHEAFPDYSPYDGAFDDVVPHLTVGHHSDPDAMTDAAAATAQCLPITGQVDRFWLMCGTDKVGGWHLVAELPLGRT